MVAAKKGDMPMVNVLLSAEGIDVNLASEHVDRGMTACHFAARDGRELAAGRRHARDELPEVQRRAVPYEKTNQEVYFYCDRKK